MSDLVDNRPCEDCGCQMLAWFAPNMIWNRVVGGPDAQYDPGGVLCPSCFIKRAEIAGIIEVWKLAPASDEDHAQAQEVSRARAEAERLREACAFLHRRRGELVLDRDRTLTRVYDILAGINDHVEVGEDGYARLGSLNDRDQLQALCDELCDRALTQEQRDD